MFRLGLLSVGLLLFISSCTTDDQNACESLRHDSLQIEFFLPDAVQTLYPQLPANTGVAGQPLYLPVSFKKWGSVSAEKSIEIGAWEWYLNDSAIVNTTGFWKFPPGNHEVSLKSGCRRITYSNGKNIYCDCLPSESSARTAVKILDTAQIRIKKIVYKKTLNCNYDFPANGCPDLFVHLVNTNRKSKEQYNDWEFTADGPAVFSFAKDTLTIPREHFVLHLYFYDYDAKVLGNDDPVQQVFITPVQAGNWSSGTYTISSWLEIEIEKL